MAEGITPCQITIKERAVLCCIVVSRPFDKVLEDWIVVTVGRAHSFNPVDRDIADILKSGIAQIVIVALSCLGIFAEFEIDISQHHIDWYEALAWVDELGLIAPVERTDIYRGLVEGRNGELFIGVPCLQCLQHLCLASQDCLKGCRSGVGINLVDGGHRVGDIWHITILTRELQIGPCTERGNGNKLVDSHLTVTRSERGVAFVQVVVTVVYHLVVKVHTVVLVRSVSRECCEVAQMCSGLGGRLYQVATHLVLIVILVSKLLHGLHDTIGIEDRVGLLIERRIKQLTRAVRVKHIGTGCRSEYAEHCDD